MYFSHLECSQPCGVGPFDAGERHHVCPSCGMPLLARYDLARARAWSRDSLAGRPPTMWRYREMLPLFPGETPITLGEGFTPLLRTCRLGDTLGLERLFVKDESFNPTNSFKARGQATAVTRAKALGATTITLPTAGNAGNAAAAYAAAAGLRCEVFMPRDAKPPFIDECHLYGATVTLVDGLITDAGRMAAEGARRHGWYDVSTLKEPYRAEGKKTMGYELAEQCGWTLPDWIVYPTGGGTGMVGMWKAFDEMEALGWIGSKRPRMISIQAAGCAPIVRAFEAGASTADEVADAHTVASGLRVPRAIGDFLILDAVRASGGTAMAVEDRALVAGARQLATTEGIFAAPEGGACVAALAELVSSGRVDRDERIVVFNPGTGTKYLEAFTAPLAPGQ